MSLNTYNPKDIDIIVGGKIISGFADTKVKVNRDSNAYEDDVGTDGDVVRYGTNDKRGSIEITLQAQSASNLYLSGLAKADELSGAGTIPTIVKDNRGNDLHAAPTSWVQKIPEAAYIKGVASRVWVIRTDNLTSLLGGS